MTACGNPRPGSYQKVVSGGPYPMANRYPVGPLRWVQIGIRRGVSGGPPWGTMADRTKKTHFLVSDRYPVGSDLGCGPNVGPETCLSECYWYPTGYPDAHIYIYIYKKNSRMSNSCLVSGGYPDVYIYIYIRVRSQPETTHIFFNFGIRQGIRTYIYIYIYIYEFQPVIFIFVLVSGGVSGHIYIYIYIYTKTRPL